MTLVPQSLPKPRIMAQPDAIRCVACRQPLDYCFCHRQAAWDSAHRVTVLCHTREWRRGSNTGHLARLGLTDASVRVYGGLNQPLDLAGLQADSHQTVVLYPGQDSQALTPDYVAQWDRPLHLVVPDGNWNQSRNLARRLQRQFPVPFVHLDAPPRPARRPRQETHPLHRSTLEAVAAAMGVLDGPEIEDHLLAIFRRAADRILVRRGKIAREHVEP